MGLLKPTLMSELGWSETIYGDVMATFSICYGIGYLVVGRFMDKTGPKMGLALSVGLWSFFAMLHAAMSTAFGFKVARGGLGLAEGGNFPASIKAVTEWFPPKEQALATGIFNAGANVGAVLAPVCVPLIVLAWGWQAGFLVTGAIGFVWVLIWPFVYKKPEDHPKVTPAELAYIKSGCDSEVSDKVPTPSWPRVLCYRGTWSFIFGTVFSAPVWFFYCNWVPGFLFTKFGVHMFQAMVPLICIFCFADVGSIFGGWLSSFLIKKGWRVLSARKMAYFVCGASVIPVIMVAYTESLWVAVALISLAAAAHQGCSCNNYTIVGDTVPKSAVGTSVGIGGFVAYLVSMVLSMGLGRLLDATNNNYSLVFMIISCFYLVGLFFMHLVLPKAGTGKTPAGIDN
jgi:ACS family hexuronate transporter-like MFS transporter